MALSAATKDFARRLFDTVREMSADVRGVIRGTVSATVETGQDGGMPDEPALPEESEANESPSNEGKEEPHDETTVE